jgi:hypothetical protein
MRSDFCHEVLPQVQAVHRREDTETDEATIHNSPSGFSAATDLGFPFRKGSQ